jgi:hypothetical protein
VFLIIVGLAVVLFVNWGISQSKAEKDKLVLQRPLPDGKLIAEIHTFRTAMWGGPDTLYVSLRESSAASGTRVYSQSYECDDVSAFDLLWQTSSQLQIKVGECNSNPSLDIDSLSRQNEVWQRESRLGSVAIQYVSAKQVATR